MNRKPNEQLKTIFLNVTANWRSDSRTMVEYCINRGQSFGIHISSGFALNHKSEILILELWQKGWFYMGTSMGCP